MSGKFSFFFLVACAVALAVPEHAKKKIDAISSETKEESEKYIRLWVDTKLDKYIRLGLNSKSIEYYNVGFFGSKTTLCENALWGVVNQVGQMQNTLNMERKKNGQTQSGRHRKGKATKR